jgi:hypothetical protein
MLGKFMNRRCRFRHAGRDNRRLICRRTPLARTVSGQFCEIAGRQIAHVLPGPR